MYVHLFFIVPETDTPQNQRTGSLHWHKCPYASVRIPVYCITLICLYQSVQVTLWGELYYTMNSSWRLPAPRTLLRTLVHRRFNNGRNPVATTHYDLVVIGSGPAAKSCAVESAKAGKKVAVVDKKGMIGGVCVHTGTIPSKTFREAVLHLTGFRHQVSS